MVTAAIEVRVIDLELDSITISPGDPSIPVGGTLQLMAQLGCTDQSSQDVTESVSWSSSDPTVAMVLNASGVARGLKVGRSSISGNSRPGTRSIAMTVTPSFPRFP